MSTLKPLKKPDVPYRRVRAYWKHSGITSDRQIAVLDDLYWVLDAALKEIGPVIYKKSRETYAEEIRCMAQDLVEALGTLIEPDEETLAMWESEARHIPTAKEVNPCRPM